MSYEDPINRNSTENWTDRTGVDHSVMECSRSVWFSAQCSAILRKGLWFLPHKYFSIIRQRQSTENEALSYVHQDSVRVDRNGHQGLEQETEILETSFH